jgi:hypothetical protein
MAALLGFICAFLPFFVTFCSSRIFFPVSMARPSQKTRKTQPTSKPKGIYRPKGTKTKGAKTRAPMPTSNSDHKVVKKEANEPEKEAKEPEKEAKEPEKEAKEDLDMDLGPELTLFLDEARLHPTWFQSFGFDMPAPRSTPENILKDHLLLSQGRQWSGVEYLCNDVAILMQTKSSESECIKCKLHHGKLIVQRIASRYSRRGYGTAFMRGLLVAAGARNLGVVLQNCNKSCVKFATTKAGMLRDGWNCEGCLVHGCPSV